MSGRLRGIAGVNAQIIAEGEYTADDGAVVGVGPALEAAISGTVSHPPDERIDLPHTVTGHRTSFEVTAESSLQAARRLHLAGAERIAVLNFASARNPGGGYLGGAKAQEEDLCRNALLYPCLLQAPDYYAAHRPPLTCSTATASSGLPTFRCTATTTADCWPIRIASHF